MEIIIQNLNENLLRNYYHQYKLWIVFQQKIKLTLKKWMHYLITPPPRDKIYDLASNISKGYQHKKLIVNRVNLQHGHQAYPHSNREMSHSSKQIPRAKNLCIYNMISNPYSHISFINSQKLSSPGMEGCRSWQRWH